MASRPQGPSPKSSRPCCLQPWPASLSRCSGLLLEGRARPLPCAPPLPSRSRSRTQAPALRGLLPFPATPCLLFCTAFPRFLWGCPFSAADTTPAPSSHLPQPSARLFLLPALDPYPPEPTIGPSASRSAASRPSGTLTSVVVKVGSRPRALMLTRAARATPVQPGAASEPASQACRGHSLPGGAHDAPAGIRAQGEWMAHSSDGHGAHRWCPRCPLF